MGILDMPIVKNIVENFWLFQNEGIVPIFKEFSFLILILFAIDFVISLWLSPALDRSKNRIILGLALFPVIVVGSFALLYYFGSYFNLDFTTIELSSLPNHFINSWWVFVLFFPLTMLLRLPFNLLQKSYGKKFGVVRAIGAGFIEEILLRYIAMNSLYLITGSIEISLLFSSIAFALMHIFMRAPTGWFGPIAINYTFIGGMVWGIFALQYGLVFAIVAHILNNVLSGLIGGTRDE